MSFGMMNVNSPSDCVPQPFPVKNELDSCRSDDGPSKDFFLRCERHEFGEVTTILTNPGIIDRLQQDVTDYLSPLGFRLERIPDESSLYPQHLTPNDVHEKEQRQKNDNNIFPSRHNSSKSSQNRHSKAVFSVPRLPYTYRSSDENTHHESNLDISSSNSGPESNLTPSPTGPIGTLHLHIFEEPLLATVGPLLRTLVRLACHIPPRRLRAVVDCHFVLCEKASNERPVRKLKKQNNKSWPYAKKYDHPPIEEGTPEKTQQQTQKQSQQLVFSNRMAHHVHMLVRNSMGSALCLELVILLPRYQNIVPKIADESERMEKTTLLGDDKSVDCNNSATVPLPAHLVQMAMKNNPDACYPSVELIDRVDTHNLNHEAQRMKENGIGSTFRDVQSHILHLDVRTRMCTVRKQPLVFRWVSSLSLPSLSSPLPPIKDHEIRECPDSCSKTTGYVPHGLPRGCDSSFNSPPLIVACIEKVANLHRILMLCHDYDIFYHGTYCRHNANDNDEKPVFSPLMSKLMVLMPNDNRPEPVLTDGERIENDERNKSLFQNNTNTQTKTSAGLEGRPPMSKIHREFEAAIDHFHDVIVAPKKNGNICTSLDSSNKIFKSDVFDESYRPKLVYSNEAISALLCNINNSHSSPFQRTQERISAPDKKHPFLERSIVGLDLHPDALTLGGNYSYPSKVQNDEVACDAALRTLRRADVVIFGFESTGITQDLIHVINSWVQIPCRSSINVVASMSIILDALFGKKSNDDFVAVD